MALIFQLGGMSIGVFFEWIDNDLRLMGFGVGALTKEKIVTDALQWPSKQEIECTCHDRLYPRYMFNNC